MRECHRQHGQLGGRAQREGADDRSARQGGDDDAESGRERELEAGIEEVAGPYREDRHGRQRQAVRYRGVPLQEERGQDEYRHDDGAQHRRRRAHHEREPDHDDDRGGGAGAPGQAKKTTERPRRPRQNRDVEAGDREDVVDAGEPEGFVDVTRQIGAIAEQETRQQGRRAGR